MEVERRVSEDFSSFQTGDQDALASLYHHVSDEMAESRTQRNYEKLWEELGPSGNIYRYCALQGARMQHCLDLQRQLHVLADRHAELLGGGAAAGRVERLKAALLSTKAERRTPHGWRSEGAGFAPLLEFLEPKVATRGRFVYPVGDDFRMWTRHIWVGLLIFTIQTVAPLLMLLDEYDKAENLHEILANLSWRQVACIGKTYRDMLTGLMGTLFAVLVMCSIKTYAQGEMLNASKTKCLGILDGCWIFGSNFANLWGCVIVVFLTPLLYFNEPDVSGIVLDAVSLLFIFTLDDLTGGLVEFLKIDDVKFTKQTVYLYAFLTQCPVRLADLVDPTATRLEHLWVIRIGQGGKLLAAGGSMPSAGKASIAGGAAAAPGGATAAPGEIEMRALEHAKPPLQEDGPRAPMLAGVLETSPRTRTSPIAAPDDLRTSVAPGGRGSPGHAEPLPQDDASRKPLPTRAATTDKFDLCECRLMVDVAEDENIEAGHKGLITTIGQQPMRYKVDHNGAVRSLPGSTRFEKMWGAMAFFVTICEWVVPALFLLTNTFCDPASVAASLEL